jgi:RNA recognition motif-containing protein
MFGDDLKPDSREQSGESKPQSRIRILFMSEKLFVGNLSFKTTENDLQDAFAAHGTVIEANLMMDRATGRPRGFAFVTMGSPEEAQKAIAALHGKEMDGRTLTVNIARPREDRPAGGGGGRRGFSGHGGGRHRDHDRY